MKQLENRKEKYDEVLEQDLHMIVQEDEVLSQLSETSILVTGATGMIGSQFVKALLLYNELHSANIQVYILARSKEKVDRVFGDAVHNQLLKVLYSDIQEFNMDDIHVDYIIHGASVTGSMDFVNAPVDTIKTAMFGTMKILEYAKKQQIKGMVYLSSLEVYGVTDPDKMSITEDELGYLNPLNVRSSYSEGKRMAECMSISYASQYHVPVKVARLCQTFGAGVEYQDGRVFAQFARNVIEKTDIVLHTKGETVRNYCYTADAIRALLYILIRGESGKAYNVANDQTAISIRDMAEMLCSHYKESGIKVVYEIEDEKKHGYNPVVKIRLNTDKLRQLGWEPKVNLLTMYERMIKSMEIRKDEVVK